MIDKKQIVLEIERARKSCDSYLDAILYVSDKYGLEEEDMSKLIGPILTRKLEVECINKRLVVGDECNSLV